MDEQYKATVETPVIEPGHTFGTVTEKISAIVLTRPASNGWFVGFGIAFLMTMMMLYAIGYLFLKGIGIWGGAVSGSSQLTSTIEDASSRRPLATGTIFTRSPAAVK